MGIWGEAELILGIWGAKAYTLGRQGNYLQGDGEMNALFSGIKGAQTLPPPGGLIIQPSETVACNQFHCHCYLTFTLTFIVYQLPLILTALLHVVLITLPILRHVPLSSHHDVARFYDVVYDVESTQKSTIVS